MGSITFESNILQLQLLCIGPITITITFENHHPYYCMTPGMINILSTIHKLDTALFKYLADKKMFTLRRSSSNTGFI